MLRVAGSGEMLYNVFSYYYVGVPARGKEASWMLPEGFLGKMQWLLGAEFEAFLAAYDRPLMPGLRENPRKRAPAAALAEFHLADVPWARDGHYYDPLTRPGLSPLHDAGAYYLQEPSAMAPAGLLGAQPGERVLDLCAAPGGKSTQLAAAMVGHGLLVCNEINPKRAKILAGNIERMGVSNALVLNEHPARLAERFAGFFDRILVDAPCSGEGMFRKEAAAVSDWSEETVLMCSRRQQEILHSAAAMLRPGGRLVYSTCTFSPEENEGTISAFLHVHADFSVLPVDAPWFAPGRPEWVAGPAPGLAHTVRLFPHKLRGEGHYAAVLQKSGDAPGAELPPEAAVKAPKELAEFCTQVGAALPEGHFAAFGESILLVPDELPELRGLKVLRAGLELGQARKGRFLPAHAWALWLQTAAQTLPLSDEQARRYLAGQTLESALRGWVLLDYGGCTLGWAKGDGQQLKNHYPKALRRL